MKIETELFQNYDYTWDYSVCIGGKRVLTSTDHHPTKLACIEQADRMVISIENGNKVLLLSNNEIRKALFDEKEKENVNQ